MNNSPVSFGNNRVCRLLGTRYPLIQAGMIWCSGWELAAAVSNAGGLGLIGSGSMNPEVLREHIRKCRAETQQPFGVNIPLLYDHAEGNLKVIAEEGVQIIFTSAGNPAKYTSMLKGQGATVVHVVASKKFALKAEAAGVDAVVAEGFEAGGHNGKEEITTFCLIPQVKSVVKIPVIAAGGIATGAGMLAAMALGAEGVQVGSRFVASRESSAHESFKQAVIHSAEDSTILALKKLTPVRLLRNEFCKAVEAAQERGADAEELKTLLGRGRSRMGMFEGDLSNGELEIGQISALLDDIKPAAEIMKDLIGEYESLKQKISDNNNGW